MINSIKVVQYLPVLGFHKFCMNFMNFYFQGKKIMHSISLEPSDTVSSTMLSPRQFFNGEFDNHKKPSPDIVSSSLFTSLECNWRCIKRSASKSGSFSCPTMTAVIFQIFTSHTKVENIYLLAVWWKTDGKISRLNIAIMIQLTRLCEGRKYLPMSHWQGVKLCEVFIKLLPTRLIATQLYLSPFLPRSKTAQQCVEFILANFWRTSTSSRSVRTS
ncbi:hypothetical protein T06_11906 [Trichinella sp. T6]|nr:hypothetical protein T06_11906 [Trichinella sp. T6]